jgi:hypothetical protein
MDEHPRASQDAAGDGLDPEIAELMGIEEPVDTGTQPAFADLFTGGQAGTAELEEVDLTRKGFPPITRFEAGPHPHLADRDYYKKVLSGEGKPAQKVHELLTAVLKTVDPKERSLQRARLSSAFWELSTGIVRRIREDLPKPKLFLLRYGLLSPSLVSREQLAVLSRIILDNEIGEPVYYQDEWLIKIAEGKIAPSATDEVKQIRQDASQKLVEKAEKRRGQRQAGLALLQSKIQELEQVEQELQRQVQCILRHSTRPEFGGLKDCFTPQQRDAVVQISTTLKVIGSLDRDIREAYASLEAMDQELDELTEKADGSEVRPIVDAKAIIAEFNSLRQMAKMCVGRQGNHFPILMKQYFRPSIREIATRENVIQLMAQTEALDSGLFLRTFKGQTNRIVPHVLLLPNYGETGICWEPFERFNRAASRGRIALPMYPKDLTPAVVTALADLRWQVAKEKAQHYWMEEGLTGRYYQWFSASKQKGDVKDAFIRDYILWITKESQGTQKLEREVRGIFWRLLPFPQELKDSLRNRGFVYSELYKKDQNIARSDGY